MWQRELVEKPSGMVFPMCVIPIVAHFSLLNRHRYEAKVIEMDDFEVHLLPQQVLMVFVCSTTGQGEEPENMKKFWRFLLRKDLPRHSLSTVNFGVVGLGDSSYQKFNFVAKKLHRRVLQLGGNPILDPALGDDQHDLGLDAAINPWLAAFWKKTSEMFPLPEGVTPLSPDYLPAAKYLLKPASEPQSRVIPDTSQSRSYSSKNPYMAAVAKNVRATTLDHFQDVRLISIDLDESGLTYLPGDVAMVSPQNSEENVNEFFEALPQLNRLQPLSLLSNKLETKLPPDWIFSSTCFTMEECARRYWDFQSVPRRSFFELLARFSRDETEREKLVEFTSAEEQQELFNYCNRPRRTILEVLQDFHKSAAMVPAEYLFDLIPAIKPRAFSIASSVKVNPSYASLFII